MSDEMIGSDASFKKEVSFPIPGVGSALGRGWREMKANFLVFFLAVLVITVMMTPFNSPDFNNDSGGEVSTLMGLVIFAYWLLLFPVLEYGEDLIFLKGVRGDGVQIKSIVSGFDNYINVVLASLLVIGLIGISLVVFVIPGIYVACRLAFTSYLVMDEGLDPIQAVEASWRITRGHAWKIFVLGFVSVLLFIVGFCLLIVGLFPAVMWSKAAFATMYLSITASDAPAHRPLTQ